VDSRPKSARKGYQERTYRRLCRENDLLSFQVLVKETDLFIQARKDLREMARDRVVNYRYQLERYIHDHPDFLHALTPVPFTEDAPPIVREMICASRSAGVGPMAAVAGAMAEFVGRDLLKESDEVLVENGGDIFLRSARELKIGILAEPSPLSLRIGLRISRPEQGLGICTSSGTVGPSLSFGRADAVCVVAPSASLADAAATAVGNVVKTPGDIPAGLETALSVMGVKGVVIIIGEKMGAWGEVDLVKM
jgi:ApbE superfamily uncharacterized protein (UPF0280 family)